MIKWAERYLILIVYEPVSHWAACTLCVPSRMHILRNCKGQLLKEDGDVKFLLIALNSTGPQCLSLTVTKLWRRIYTTFTNFSMKYLVMCIVYTDDGGIK